MKYKFPLLFFLAMVIGGGLAVYFEPVSVSGIVLSNKTEEAIFEQKTDPYWILLHRKSQKEYLYKGEPGNTNKSIMVREFLVKTGVPGKKPTPLPQAYDRAYWIITEKRDSSENPETAPYFIQLDIPWSMEPPYGPVPYDECDGQCDWELPGAFGLHGVNGDESKLSLENDGSSGCIRHTDDDISYLYNVLDLDKEVRYYIEDV